MQDINRPFPQVLMVTLTLTCYVSLGKSLGHCDSVLGYFTRVLHGLIHAGEEL